MAHAQPADVTVGNEDEVLNATSAHRVNPIDRRSRDRHCGKKLIWRNASYWLAAVVLNCSIGEKETMSEAAQQEPIDNVTISQLGLDGMLGLPLRAKGVVLLAHGSGSGRHSPRNNFVARALRDSGLATLLFDLLTVDEERDRRNVFNIELLAQRLLTATTWVRGHREMASLAIGYFGASTGAAAALVAAAARDNPVAAIVSCGGRLRSRRAGAGRGRGPDIADRRRRRYRRAGAQSCGLRQAALRQTAHHRARRHPPV